jgi:Pyruvate kinase
MKTPTYVATNLLETMIQTSTPTRAESHDIYSTLKQGAEGLVLAAETAIGIDPVNCVRFLKKCIKNYRNNNIRKYI